MVASNKRKIAACSAYVWCCVRLNSGKYLFSITTGMNLLNI